MEHSPPIEEGILFMGGYHAMIGDSLCLIVGVIISVLIGYGVFKLISKKK